MSATRCTCLYDGLTVTVPDADCPAAYIHITTSKEQATA